MRTKSLIHTNVGVIKSQEDKVDLVTRWQRALRDDMVDFLDTRVARGGTESQPDEGDITILVSDITAIEEMR